MRLIYRPDAGDGSTGGDAGQTQNQTQNQDHGEQKPQAQQPDEKRFSQTDYVPFVLRWQRGGRRRKKSLRKPAARQLWKARPLRNIAGVVGLVTASDQHPQCSEEDI